MKRKGFSILFSLVLVISISLAIAVPVSAADLEVGSGKPYATIAAAISAAADGDTIIVYAGTYGKVVVSKELTIQAAAGNSPIVDGGGSGACFGIYKSAGLSNVTIEGFEIKNAKFGIWIYGAGASSTTYDNITLSNNDIHDHSENGILTTDVTVNVLTISGNTFNNSGIGISFDRAIVDSLKVDGNEITNGNVGLAFFSGSYSSVEVSNCYFEGNAWEHIDLGAWGKWPSLSGINIDTCQFLAGPWCAIWVESHFSDYDVVLRYNLFGVGDCGICNKSTHIVDAELNWWGHVSGPYDDKDMDGLSLVNTGGLGDIVGGTLWCGDVDYVDYEPWLGQGGWVTGGGWIDSPPGAYMPGPTNIAGTFTGAYTSRFTNIQCDPNNTPITFTGSVEVTGIQPNGAVMIGLIDQGLYDSGSSLWETWGSGAYLYLGRIGTNVRIGPSDGFMGGELNQVGANVPYVDGGPNLIEFSMTIYDGQITVTYEGVDYVDTYGGIEDMNTTDAYSGSEFDSGAYVGLDSYPADNTVVYDINISGCSCTGPTGKATFGFVAKYKKGASVPEGNTEFVFRAADLNFHSSSYDWLVVTGSDYARFKGTGTINGIGDYKFMLWAGDGTGTDGADTFRIKIWEEDGLGNETVIYDNGMNQAIGGGSIVVHTK